MSEETLFKYIVVKLLKYLLLGSALVFLLGGILFFSLTESRPAVNESAVPFLDNADSVSALISQIKRSLANRDQTQRLVLTEEQVNSLIGFAQRAWPEVTGRVQMHEGQATLAATYHFPASPMGEYVNVHLGVLNGKRLIFDEVKIGWLSLSGELLLNVVTWIADWRTNSDIASEFVRHIEQIAITPDSLTVTFRPLSQFLQQLNRIKHGIGSVQNEPIRERTAHYLAHLAGLSLGRLPRATSLNAYLNFLFAEVQQRSKHGDPVLENEAAILALAIYAGHHRLANLVGDVQPIKGQAALPYYRPELAERTDLTQHFLLSAAFEVLSRQQVSLAIGEFKELVDRAKGGSGFSFVDLAADMAGVTFAAQLSDPGKAAKAQQMLIESEGQNVFFPDITGLPEGLSKQAFTEVYGEIDSAKYTREVAEIRRRIDALPLYRL